MRATAITPNHGETSILPSLQQRRSKTHPQRRLETQPVLEKDSLPLHACAAPDKKIAQLPRVKVAVIKRIEPKKDFAARRQKPLQIAQEKIPLRRSPAAFGRMIQIEIDRKRRDPIERLPQVRQRFERGDGVKNTGHIEKLQQLREQRDVADVETQHGMTKLPGNEKEKTAAAPEIEHALRGRAMKLQILYAFAIQA